MSDKSGITRDEWLQALDDVRSGPPNDPAARTTKQLALLWKVSERTAQRHVADLVARERAKVVRVTRTTVDGRVNGNIVAYKLLPPK